CRRVLGRRGGASEERGPAAAAELDRRRAHAPPRWATSLERRAALPPEGGAAGGFLLARPAVHEGRARVSSGVEWLSTPHSTEPPGHALGATPAGQAHDRGVSARVSAGFRPVA